MANPTEQRMIAILQQINAAIGSISGLRPAQVVADESISSRSFDHAPTTPYKVLVINTSKLAVRAEPASEDPKKASPTKKAGMTVLVQVPLPVGPPYKIAEVTIAKEGSTVIELPFCPVIFTVDIRLDEGTDAKYSICGI